MAKQRKNELTAKQQIFRDVYIKTKNGTDAYLAAYPNTKLRATAGACANQLLQKPKIKEAIDKALRKQQKRLEISSDKVIREMARLAFFDIRKLYDEDGKLKPIHELDDDTAAAIAGIDVSVYTRAVDGDEKAMEEVKKFKVFDKSKNIDSLAKHFGLYEKDNNQKKELSAGVKAFLGLVVGDAEETWRR